MQIGWWSTSRTLYASYTSDQSCASSCGSCSCPSTAPRQKNNIQTRRKDVFCVPMHASMLLWRLLNVECKGLASLPCSSGCGRKQADSTAVCGAAAAEFGDVLYAASTFTLLGDGTCARLTLADEHVCRGRGQLCSKAIFWAFECHFVGSRIGMKKEGGPVFGHGSLCSSRQVCRTLMLNLCGWLGGENLHA